MVFQVLVYDQLVLLLLDKALHLVVEQNLSPYGQEAKEGGKRGVAHFP
jgi:hypothetical protein